MPDKIFGLDFTNDTNPSGSFTVSVNNGTTLVDVSLAQILKIISALTSDTVPDIADSMLTYDASASDVKRVTLDNLLKIINGLTADASPASGDYLGTYDVSASAAKKVLLSNLHLALTQATTSQAGTIELATNAETLTGTDTTRGVTPDDLEYSRSVSGWTPDTNTWSYSSADSPTFVISVNADMTGKIGVGDRIKLTQTTSKYFIVTKMGTFSAGATLITVYGGTDFTLANAAISSPFYSHEKVPFGFNPDPDKWTVSTITTDSPTKTSPAANTWYGDTGLTPTGPSISIPIGAWRVWYRCVADVNITLAAVAAVGSRLTMSTANNSESDAEFTTGVSVSLPIATDVQRAFYSAEKDLNLASKTTYYLNVFTGNTGATNILMNPAGVFKNVIKAVCAYL